MDSRSLAQLGDISLRSFRKKKQIILYLLFGDQPDVCFDSEIALIRAENNSSNLGSILLKAERKRDIVEKRILCKKKKKLDVIRMQLLRCTKGKENVTF